MKKNNQNNIIITGSGLSGMICTLALAKNNIPTLIIESKSSYDTSFFDDIRTTAITPYSKEFLEQIDVWEKISKHMGKINDIYVVDNKAPKMLHYFLDNQCLGYLIENSIFKKSLFDLVKSNKLITLLENTKYTQIQNKNEGCSIVLDNSKKLNCKLIIACDGRNSAIKNLFFSNQIDKNYKQQALTFIVKHEKNHEGTAVEHFMPSGPFAILPLIDTHKSSIVWTVENDKASVLMNLPKDEFIYLVQQNFGQFLGKIEIISKIAAFPLKAHAVKKYYNKNIVLVADTAHIIHPLAGQGLNQGIKDIECLSGLISNDGIELKNLNIYEKYRQRDNEDMLILTDSINSIFSQKSRILQATRQIGFDIIEKIPGIKKNLIKYAMGRR